MKENVSNYTRLIHHTASTLLAMYVIMCVRAAHAIAFIQFAHKHNNCALPHTQRRNVPICLDIPTENINYLFNDLKGEATTVTKTANDEM